MHPVFSETMDDDIPAYLFTSSRMKNGVTQEWPRYPELPILKQAGIPTLTTLSKAKRGRSFLISHVFSSRLWLVVGKNTMVAWVDVISRAARAVVSPFALPFSEET